MKITCFAHLTLPTCQFALSGRVPATKISTVVDGVLASVGGVRSHTLAHPTTLLTL